MSVRDKRALVEPKLIDISVTRQCELLGIARSGLYYRPLSEPDENLVLLRILDETYTKYPYFGSRRMTYWLRNLGYCINRKRIIRLMQKLGLATIYPGPKTSKSNPEHKVYPYLLRDIQVKSINHVWSTDITYIRLRSGFIYLTAVIDWYSRYVLSWEISNTLDSDFCISALDRAFRIGKPVIFNTDQGSQYTSHDFTGRLISEGIQISMDGRGRALDNIFVERLWRCLKYEEVYLKDYESVRQATEELGNYFNFYNELRPHQSLGYKTPSRIYHCK